jgi:protein phosphatase
MSTGQEDEVARRAVFSPILRYDDFRPLSASVQVEVAAQSVRGRSRAVNEDHYLLARFGRQQQILDTSLSFTDLPDCFEEYAYAMVIADGLGGAGRGAVASRVALSTMAHVAMHFGKWNVRVDPQVASEVIQRAAWFYNQADRAVFARSQTDPRLSGMATTLTLAYSAGNDLFVANVGHSRAYLFRDGALTQLTRDDTLAQRFSGRHGPAPVETGIQDLRHILTDTIGGDAKRPLVEVGHFRLQDGDWVLLCTNGLYDVVPDDRIADVLALRRQPAEQCALLLDLAHLNGGDDNATVVAATYRIPVVQAPPFVPGGVASPRR